MIDLTSQKLMLKWSTFAIHLRYFRSRWRLHTAGARWAGKPESLPPSGVARESTRSSAASGPVSGNSRMPWPMITGQTNRVISSTSWLSNRQRIRPPLPCTRTSPSRLAFSSPLAPTTSPARTVVFAHCGSVSVVDATYLGCVFKAAAMGLVPRSIPALARHSAAPQDRAKISQVRLRRRGLVVEQRPDPSAALESAAAVLVRPAESLHHSVDGDHRDGRQFHGRSSLLAEFCRRSIRPGRGADLIRRSRVNGDVSSEPPTWCVRGDSSNIAIESCGRGMIRNDPVKTIIRRNRQRQALALHRVADAILVALGQQLPVAASEQVLCAGVDCRGVVHSEIEDVGQSVGHIE